MTKVLHLTLFKECFDAIVQGSKKEEYRERKKHWDQILNGKDFDEVWFRNGRKNTSSFMRVECLEIEKTDTQWIIKLGKILEVRQEISIKLEDYYIERPEPASSLYHVFRKKDNRSLCGKYAMLFSTEETQEELKSDMKYKKGQDCKECFKRVKLI